MPAVVGGVGASINSSGDNKSDTKVVDEIGASIAAVADK